MSAVEETKAKDTSKPITNEFPQAYNEPDSYFCEETYALCMVGLPGMGKTFVAQRLARWLEFFHDVTVKVFNLGNARRKAVGSKVSSEFFNPSKHGNQEVYKKIRSNVIQEIKEFLVADKRPRIAIYDACSHTKETRRYLEQELGKKNTKIIFIECIVNDKLVLNEYLAEVQKDMPDYKGLDGAQTRKDYAKRIEHFRKRYEPLDDESKSWIKLVDNAEQLTLNRISGFFPGQIVNFLMNLHTVPRPIYLSRHGQSQYNALGKIGGDSGLTLEGLKYAKELAKFVKEHVLTGGGCENKEKDQCENASHARL